MDEKRARVGSRDAIPLPPPLPWERAGGDPPRWVQVIDGQVVAELGVDDVAGELNALVAAVARRA